MTAATENIALLSALQRLGLARMAEDAAWSAVLRSRATYEGACAAGAVRVAAQAYADWVGALKALGPPVVNVVTAAAVLDRIADAVDRESSTNG